MESEEDRLRTFCEMVAELKQTKLYQRVTSRESYHINDVTKEEWLSFLVVYRKLFVSNEPSGFHASWSLVLKYSDDEARKRMKRSADSIKDYFKWSDSVIKTEFKDGRTGKKTIIDFDSIIRSINGGIFHPGTREDREFLSIIQSEDGVPESFVWPKFLLRARLKCEQAVDLASYIEMEHNANRVICKPMAGGAD